MHLTKLHTNKSFYLTRTTVDTQLFYKEKTKNIDLLRAEVMGGNFVWSTSRINSWTSFV